MKQISLRAFGRARRLAPLLALALSAASLAALPAATQESLQGEWLADYRVHGGKDGQLNRALRYREEKRTRDGQLTFSNSNFTRWVREEELHGLTRGQAFSSAGTQVRFQLRRDAGTFDCEGWFKDGRGSGHFTFLPSAQFASELQRRGAGAPDARQLLALALSDTGLALLDELQAQGYERPDVEGLVSLGNHGVSLEYVRGLGGLGYRLGSLAALRRMVDHGVNLAFIRELREHGIRNLSADELVRLRDHGVSVSFIRELRAEGYASLPLETLVRLRDHGVSVKFIRDLKELGYANLSPEQLVRLKDHGVSAAFVRRVRSERGAAPAVEELIRIKDRGEWE